MQPRQQFFSVHRNVWGESRGFQKALPVYLFAKLGSVYGTNKSLFKAVELWGWLSYGFCLGDEKEPCPQAENWHPADQSKSTSFLRGILSLRKPHVRKNIAVSVSRQKDHPRLKNRKSLKQRKPDPNKIWRHVKFMNSLQWDVYVPASKILVSMSSPPTFLRVFQISCLPVSIWE